MLWESGWLAKAHKIAREEENTGTNRGLKEKIMRAVFRHIEFNILLVHAKSEF